MPKLIDLQEEREKRLWISFLKTMIAYVRYEEELIEKIENEIDE